MTKHEQEESIEEDPSSFLFLEMKKIRVNKKKRINNDFYFHFKETYYKNRYVYKTFYLDGNQENLKLKIFLDKKNKNLK